MAGEYYRWLARNEQNREKKELTPAEKRRNWWAYNKWYLAAGLAVVILVAAMFSSAVRSNRDQADYRLVFVGTSTLPHDTAAALEQSIADLGEDLNGNGEVRVELIQYQLRPQKDPEEIQTSVEQVYSTSMQLLVTVETAENMIYILEDPELFAANYPILTRVDGSDPMEDPDSNVPMWYRWEDCPVLTGLDLGAFQVSVEEGMVQGDNQQVMSSLYIARRGVWGDDANEITDGAQRLWQILTEGAPESESRRGDH